jgi:type II secretory pathway component PulJ
MVKTMWCRGIKMNFKFKTGFTLMELMVYIALLGGIVLIAGQAFSDSTKMRIRTQSMLQANQIAGNVSSILKEDLTQLGAKSSQEAPAAGATMDAFSTDHMHDVFMDPDNADNTKKDSSSYSITENHGSADFDSLTLRRVRYDDNGHYVAVEQISWFVEDHTLKRGCQTISGTEDTDLCPTSKPNVVSMAEGIENFKVHAAEPGAKESTSRIFPSSDTSKHDFRLVPRYGDYYLAYTNVEPSEGGLSVTLSSFASNYDFANQAPITDGKNANQVFVAEKNGVSDTWKNLCKKVTLDSNVTYEISFTMPYSSDASRLFCPGRDYMSFGFRRSSDGTKPSQINDFLFFPPTNAGASEGTRRFRFKTKNKLENVCMAFTFASYSPVVATGKITISGVVLKKVETANYTFSGSAISINDKKNVKALQVEFVVNIRGESNVLSLIIPIPSNGTKD